MKDVQDCLAEWRHAERLRDALLQDGAGLDDAEQDVRQARLVYQATFARVAARYREADCSAPSVWWPAPPIRALVR